ncbi:hypothetical protein BDZ97DRAFT_1902889 [Flammula alnicola]|nr:hypothetical protein BDZ97DRAFT_1902889 [Flammula alnicola]
MDRIRIEYHPNTGKTSETFSFEDYCNAPEEPPIIPPTDETPWCPFPTRLDFEVSEVMLDVHMNKKQIAKMIELIHQAIASPQSFTLANEADHSQIWEYARETRAVAFQKRVISVKYKEEELSYDVWTWPIWTCSHTPHTKHLYRELLLDETLIHKFQWNAERLSKFNGEKYEHFVDEPWTANAWWNYQSTLPVGALPFCIILYADKTRLSSFGTEKGYPVLVRCANLPVHIRNGEGVGGGRLIGWLPIPKEDAQERGKKGFVNLKREIWHQAVYEIIQSIELHTKIGTSVECADNVVQQIFPHILIISADFEEQSMIALTHGGTSNFPCTICLVPKAEIPNLSKEFDMRTTQTMQEVWDRAQDMNSTDREELLKGYGLRDVKNVLWGLRGTDVYRALSWDKLHAHDAGLWADHLLEEVKRILKELPTINRRNAEAEIDTAFNIPPWSGLTHFKSLSSTGEMADGSKFEDLSKVFIFASQHILTPDVSKEGFHLLKLIRSYLELNMFASVTVQTETTIAAGKAEMQCFEELLHVYEKLNPLKAWTFPKVHTHQHIFRDIMDKGVTRNYNTKPSEKANGPLKTCYQRHTNFKNVASQILRVSEMDLVSTIIRNGIDTLDRHANEPGPDVDVMTMSMAGDLESEEVQETPRVVHRSIRPNITIADLEQGHSSDAAFQGFCKKLADVLARCRGVQRVTLRSQEQITPYQFVKVAFTSMIDWRLNDNILRANPNFHNRPRYDYTLIKVHAQECIFARILYIFHDRPRDEALQLTRLRARPRASREFLVVDVIDQDMWMRMKSIVLVHHAAI